MVHVVQTTRNLAISLSCFAEDGKEMYQESYARAQPLFCSLNLLFSDVAVAVAVVAFSNSLLLAGDATDVITTFHYISISIPPARRRSGFNISTDLHYSSDDEISPRKRVDW